VLRVLADPLRAHLVEILAGATQSNVSNHLRALRQAGLVAREPHGRFAYYRLVPEALDTAAHHLADLAERARATIDQRREC
jgi:ArsR family transcriptional regulator